MINPVDQTAEVANWIAGKSLWWSKWAVVGSIIGAFASAAAAWAAAYSARIALNAVKDAKIARSEDDEFNAPVYEYKEIRYRRTTNLNARTSIIEISANWIEIDFIRTSNFKIKTAEVLLAALDGDGNVIGINKKEFVLRYSPDSHINAKLHITHILPPSIINLACFILATDFKERSGEFNSIGQIQTTSTTKSENVSFLAFDSQDEIERMHGSLKEFIKSDNYKLSPLSWNPFD